MICDDTRESVKVDSCFGGFKSLFGVQPKRSIFFASGSMRCWRMSTLRNILYWRMIESRERPVNEHEKSTTVSWETKLRRFNVHLK